MNTRIAVSAVQPKRVYVSLIATNGCLTREHATGHWWVGPVRTWVATLTSLNYVLPFFPSFSRLKKPFFLIFFTFIYILNAYISKD